MQAGKLRNKAALYTPTTARGTDGSIESETTLVGTFYCSVRQSAHDEKMRADELVSRVRYRLQFRYNEDLKSIPANSYIILNGSEKLHVLSSYVVGANRNKTIEVLAEEQS